MIAFRKFAALAALFAFGCTQENQYQPPPPPVVKVSKPLVQDVTIYHEETGTTKAFERVEIRARVEGFLEEIAFTSGEMVKGPDGDEPGDLLFLIDPRPFQARLDQAKAALLVAEADFRAKDSAYQRSVPLANSGTITAQELLDYQAARDAAEASMTAAQAEIDEAQLNVNYATIRAPISGRVGDALVDKGNLVGRNEATLLTAIVQQNPIYADFYIPGPMYEQFLEDHADELRSEDRERVPLYLRLQIDEDYHYTGSVYYADDKIDESTGTYRIRGVFDNERLVIAEGASVLIRFVVREAENAVLIPQRAVSVDRGGSYVFLVDEKDIVERRYVTLGERIGNMVIVTQNLTGDDLLIIDGLQRAREDQAVRAEPIELEGIAPDDIDGEPATSPTAESPSANEDENELFEQEMEDPAPATGGTTEGAAPQSGATEGGTGS